MTRLAAALAGIVTVASCTSAGKPPARDPRFETTGAFARDADAFVDGVLYAEPHLAVRLGLHGYDGKLPDLSQASTDAHIAWLRRAERRFKAYRVSDLSQVQRVERDAILARIAGSRFVLEVLDAPRRLPLFYLLPLWYTPYVAHRYASATQRARALARLGRGASKLAAAARRRLGDNLAAPQVGIALFIAAAMQKASLALPGVLRQQGARIDAAMARDLAALPRALGEIVALLEERATKAKAPFALGKARYGAMLRAMGIELDLTAFEKLARHELAKHYAAILEAAKRLDRTRPPAQVIARVLADRATPQSVFAVANSQAAALRQLIVKKKIVTIPSADRAEVVPSPPFMRFNFAFLNAPGVFSGTRDDLPSYYYISPPNPSWPEKKQREYIMATPALYFVTAHEVWPGHFLDFLHAKKHSSRVLRALQDGMRLEGWAHYVEQVMLDDALGRDDPKMVIGMLLNALLRDVRFIASIGLHTQGKSVAWATALFRSKAFLDAGNAQQQAMRGTFDPSYFRYTVGKLMIQKLRADLEAKAGGKLDLRRFHDRFLGCCAVAPIPAIRRALLGEDAGPAL